MSIQLSEALEFLSKFLDVVMNSGTAKEQADFFNHAHPRTHFMRSGETVSMEQQHQAHQDLSDETFEFGDFEITTLSDSPERARIIGTLLWEATMCSSNERIKAVVEDDLILERGEDGKLKFVFFGINGMHMLSGASNLT